MFWNRKKKENSESDEFNLKADEEMTESTEEDEELADFEDYDEKSVEEDADEDEISDEDADDSENAQEAEVLTTKQITCKIKSLDQLATFANKRGNGVMQFMSKKNHEVFELRDAHFRIAQVWGTVTMARECSADEYARVMLAIELRDNRDDFYMLPGLTENEVKGAIEDFCRDNFSVNGKKYSRKPEKFTKLLKENDRREEWDEYTKALVYDKLEAFCNDNGIVFDENKTDAEEVTEENGSDS